MMPPAAVGAPVEANLVVQQAAVEVLVGVIQPDVRIASE
jgi:hypothetical protein